MHNIDRHNNVSEKSERRKEICSENTESDRERGTDEGRGKGLSIQREESSLHSIFKRTARLRATWAERVPDLTSISPGVSRGAGVFVIFIVIIERYELGLIVLQMSQVGGGELEGSRPELSLVVCLSVPLSVCMYIYRSICLPDSDYLSVCLPFSVHLSACRSIYPSVCISNVLTSCLSVYLSVSLSVLLPICRPICPPVSLLICLSLCLSACLYVYISVCYSIFMPSFLFIYLFLSPSPQHNPLHLDVTVSLSHSLYL